MRAYMHKKNIAFVERDIEANPAYRAEARKLGSKGVPFLVFDDKTLSGFTEASFDQTFAMRAIRGRPRNS